jgi:L-idonate 5-dehydrogenase
MLAAVLHGKHDLRVMQKPDEPMLPDEVRVRVAFGGICGSDMHYYHRGAVGDFAIREPMTLGHEISGEVIEVGSAVGRLKERMKVALNPSRPCRQCEYCRIGRSNLCLDMRFLGSAARTPHVQGGFAQHIVLRGDQCIPVPDETDLLQLSCAEPLSVALHAVSRAGPLLGKRVIVTGSGPIGLLTTRVAVLAGALQVVATDIEDAPLALARSRMGARRTVNVASDPGALTAFEAGGGYFDVALEASGTVSALGSLFRIVKRGGRIVQLGMLPAETASLPVNVLQSREIDLVGSFRAHEEFGLAVETIVSGQIDVTPILSGTYPLEKADEAFAVAGDRKTVVKVHLALNQDA